MSDPYAREILRRNVAQICQTIGWNGINSTPMDILVHVLEKYIKSLGIQSSRYAEQFNRTEPNLNDLGLVFRDMNIHLSELTEYTNSVPAIPPPVQVDTFPKPKESNLNFLKPGSHEVVTRPVHVHEHLPPMYPEKEQETPSVSGTIEILPNDSINNDDKDASCTSPDISATDTPETSKSIFKRPIDPVSLLTSKKPRIRLEEEERTREISSVMMTMSGFLSPAREGKLPEARPPTVVVEKHFDKAKTGSHHSGTAKTHSVDKNDKKSKKNKLTNGKDTKTKRKDKSHKGDSSKIKSSSKHPPGLLSKDSHQAHTPAKSVGSKEQILLPKTVPLTPPISATSCSTPEPVNPFVKKEPPELAPSSTIVSTQHEDMIPVPRKIPISKSPLLSNPSTPVLTPKPSINAPTTETVIKKELVDDQEKLASQPDKSKINIFKRISNKNKEDRSVVETASEKSHTENTISKQSLHVGYNISSENKADRTKLKTDEKFRNNNDTTVTDLSKELDLRAHEVINIDDDSLDAIMPQAKLSHDEVYTKVTTSKILQTKSTKEASKVNPKPFLSKIKKEKKHKDKKDKAAKLEAKLLKKQKQQMALEMAQTDKPNLKVSNVKPHKTSRPKSDPKLQQKSSGFPYFPAVSSSRDMMPSPGLISSPGLIPGNDFLAGLVNNPALRGLSTSNLLTNPFALSTSGPGLIPATSFLPGNLGGGMPNPLLHMSNFPHTARSTSTKIPTMLRRPSLEVTPVDNDDDCRKTEIPHEKHRHDKHKSPTVPNILQKHKSKSQKDHKSKIYEMPPIQPDITIELNPPKVEMPKQDLPKPLLPSTSVIEPVLQLKPPDPKPEPPATANSATQESESVLPEKKKDKSHKKEKKDKDGNKIKKKKDKKDKNKDKAERKKEKSGKNEIKERIKKEKKEKKKEKSGEGIVPKLTLKLSSSTSNSPMPQSSPDLFKLNIKPVIKQEGASPPKDTPQDIMSRENSRSPELAQISALVTRPPKLKHSKHQNLSETEIPSSSGDISPTRKNRPPSGHGKYKRILIKPLSKKGHFEDDVSSVSEDPPTSASSTTATPAKPLELPSGPLPTPYYVDDHGNKVWVCPACGRPDNGSPMIGCDGCDGWYHWVCVGITEEPGATEDWFCKSCVAKRAAMVLAGIPSGKKRGRKPKGEKVRE